MSNHKVEGMKGKFKETVGNITGDKGLQIEGKLDQAVASAKKQIDTLTDKVTHKTATPESDKNEAPQS